MPAKPLTADQKADAARLKTKFDAWQASRRSQNMPYSQAWAAAQMGFGEDSQSVVSQYLNGKIPLNAEAANKFANLIGCGISEISEALFLEISGLAEGLDTDSGKRKTVVQHISQRHPISVIIELGEMLLPMDVTDRGIAEVILRDLVASPQRAPELATKFKRMLGEITVFEAERKTG